MEEEIIKPNEKTLAVITNQYMLLQVLWYYSKYPDGMWDALIIPFNENNHQLVDIMYKQCVDCGIFSRIYVYDQQNSFMQKVKLMLQYILQCIFKKRDEYDKSFVKQIIETDNYKKLIIHARNNRLEVALANAMRDKICICMEDGMGDYVPEINVWKIRHVSDIFPYILAKMNILTEVVHGGQFRLKYDNKLIKYSSLPDKMQYKNYKKIKQLFESDTVQNITNNMRTNRSSMKSYDLIVFSCPFDGVDNSEMAYQALRRYLTENYSNKKVLIKPHPRETYQFEWNDPNVEIGCLDMAGEEVLDVFPDVKLLFVGTSTILIKACRTNRDFRIITFNCIKSKRFHRHIEEDSQLVGITKDKFVYL